MNAMIHALEIQQTRRQIQQAATRANLSGKLLDWGVVDRLKTEIKKREASMIKTGDYCCFVPPPLQDVPEPPWLPGIVRAVHEVEGVVDIDCQLEQGIDASCSVRLSWVRESNFQEVKRLIDDHNNSVFEKWLEGGK